MSTTKDHRIIQPYLFFNGNCEPAVEFYGQALGAKVEMMMRFKDSPEPPQPGMVPPGYENKVMHSSLRIGDTTVMAADGCASQKAGFQGFSLLLSVPTVAQADRAFTALWEGGQVRMPLTKTFWSPLSPTEEERKTFDGAHEGMKQGWTGTFDQLAGHLPKR
jgi:PhnB protein